MNIHYYLIINEQASSGNGRKVARKVIQQLKQQELKYTALYTDYAGHEEKKKKIKPFSHTLAENVNENI